MEEKLVTLSTYPNLTEASIVYERLQNEGIEANVVDSNAFFSASTSGADYGGVKLNIRESDLNRALAIINSEVTLDDQNIQ